MVAVTFLRGDDRIHMASSGNLHVQKTGKFDLHPVVVLPVSLGGSFAGFALVALALATTGLYSVMSCTVA